MFLSAPDVQFVTRRSKACRSFYSAWLPGSFSPEMLPRVEEVAARRAQGLKAAGWLSLAIMLTLASDNEWHLGRCRIIIFGTYLDGRPIWAGSRAMAMLADSLRAWVTGQPGTACRCAGQALC
jgi:hypothetical protein